MLDTEFLAAWWRFWGFSVLTAQESVISKPESMRDLARVSQAPESLWLNWTVITPSSRRTRWYSAKARAIFAS